MGLGKGSKTEKILVSINESSLYSNNNVLEYLVMLLLFFDGGRYISEFFHVAVNSHYQYCNKVVVPGNIPPLVLVLATVVPGTSTRVVVLVVHNNCISNCSKSLVTVEMTFTELSYQGGSSYRC